MCGGTSAIMALFRICVVR